MAANGTRDPMGKVVTILRWIVDNGPGPFGVRQIATSVGLAPSTTHRILGLLRDQGLVEGDEQGSYSYGPELYRIAHIVIQSFSLRTAALPRIQVLLKESHESVVLCTYRPETHEIMFVLVLYSDDPLRYTIDVGRWIPLQQGTTSVAILAFLDKAEQRTLIDEVLSLPPLTPQSVSSEEDLQREISETIKCGFALTKSQRYLGAVGIASPIFGPRSAVVGAVGLTIPEARFDEARRGELGEMVRICAARISVDLVGRDDQLPEIFQSVRP